MVFPTGIPVRTATSPTHRNIAVEESDALLDMTVLERNASRRLENLAVTYERKSAIMERKI